MNSVIKLTEKELIEENANYVLGMFDMYNNDQEIVDLLKMKGLSDKIVHNILIKIKKPAYEKRVKQAKVMIGTGLILLIAFVVIPFLMIQYSNYGSTAQQAYSGVVINGKSSLISERRTGGETFIAVFKFLVKIGFFVILFGISQLAIGTLSLFKYKQLLKNI
jgi:hypothetical protein